MKIGISHIVVDHISTLRNAKSGRISFIDLLLFYALPLGASIGTYFGGVSLSDGVMGQSIAVFAIFSALLFSVQVALFGIYTKKRPEVDEFREAFALERLRSRMLLIRETNANISYLIVMSSLSVTCFLVFISIGLTDKVEPAIGVFLYTHFMLNLLMVIKRVHALFDKEYRFDSI